MEKYLSELDYTPRLKQGCSMLLEFVSPCMLPFQNHPCQLGMLLFYTDFALACVQLEQERAELVEKLAEMKVKLAEAENQLDQASKKYQMLSERYETDTGALKAQVESVCQTYFVELLYQAMMYFCFRLWSK